MEEKSEQRLPMKKQLSKWKYTAEFCDGKDFSNNAKGIEGSLSILELEPSERSWKKIRQAFRILASKWHPDRREEGNEEAFREYAFAMGEIVKAYSYLRESRMKKRQFFKN